ncbi:MAG: antibiotic biosynthesis monooxygenase [Verrucomicrobiota bacterium]
MILEIATFDVLPGKEAEYETAITKAIPIIASMKGHVSNELKRCIEKPSRYVFLVTWETLEDHTVGFRTSEEYKEWSALLHHFYESKPSVEHYEIL